MVLLLTPFLIPMHHDTKHLIQMEIIVDDHQEKTLREDKEERRRHKKKRKKRKKNEERGEKNGENGKRNINTASHSPLYSCFLSPLGRHVLHSNSCDPCIFGKSTIP